MERQNIVKRLKGWRGRYRWFFHFNERNHDSQKRKIEFGLIILVGILFSFAYYLPIINSTNNLGIQDWDQNFAWTEANRITILTYHQFPLWDPYKCGGMAQFANPQVPVISIQMLLALLFGTMDGIKLSIFLHGIIGFVGFYYLARHFKLSYLGSTLAAVIFSFSGITGSFLSTGMVVFTNVAYTPYVFLFFDKGIHQRKWAMISGILFALSFYYSYQIPLLLGLFIFIYAAIYSIVHRSITALKGFIIMSLVASVLIMPKLLLSLQLIHFYSRQIADVSGYSVYNFFYFLLSRNQNLFGEMDVKGYFGRIDENSIYIGVIDFILFAFFFIKNRAGIRSNIVLIVMLPVIFWLMLGSEIVPSLYNAIRHLPILSSFRVAERFRFDLIIPLALLIGLGFDNLLHIISSPKLVFLIAAICLVAISADLITFSTINFLSKTLIIVNPEKQLVRQSTFLQTQQNNPDFRIERTIVLPKSVLGNSTFFPWSYEYTRIIQNEGVLNCYDPLPITTNATGVGEPNYQGEFYLSMANDAVQLENVYWSPNNLVFSISNSEQIIGNTLIINQNFYPGWVVVKDAKKCERAIASNGLISTRIDRSYNRISFEFNPIEYYTVCH